MRLSGRKNIIKDIRRHAFYNSCLIATIVILSVILFAGSVISSSLRKGMDNMQRRLGADIMLVPKNAKEKAENMLLEGSRSKFYFDPSVYEKVKTIEGISEMTSQSYLTSLAADCCSSQVEIVFFDPQTDFVVGPWIEKEYKGNLKGNQVVIGSDISIEQGTIKLFGQVYPVVSQMAKTGTALDSSVYFASDAMSGVLTNAQDKGAFLTEEQKHGHILSSLFINVDDDRKVEDVIDDAHRAIGDVFDVVYPKQLNESLAGNLVKITEVVNIVSLFFSAFLIAILLIINSVIMKSRKQEVALFRVLGHTKKDLIVKLVTEIGFISLSGSLAGCLLGALIVIPFGRYIGMSLNMPYLGPNFVSTIIWFGAIIAIVFLLVFLSSIHFIIHTTNVEPYLALRKEE